MLVFYVTFYFVPSLSLKISKSSFFGHSDFLIPTVLVDHDCVIGSIIETDQAAEVQILVMLSWYVCARLFVFIILIYLTLTFKEPH